MIIELILGLGCLATWDGWRRYLKHKHELAGLRAGQETRILSELSVLQESVDKQPVVFKTFLESIFDLMKLQEAEKQNLRNKVEAAKLGRKQ